MLLPDGKRRGEIHFYVAKGLPYNVRLALAFGLLFLGLVIQTALITSVFWIGLPFTFAGVLLLLTKGYENNPRMKRGTEEWRPAQTKEVRRILDIQERQQKWDQDLVDATCSSGCLILVLLTLCVGGAAAVASRVAPVAVPMIIANGAVVLLPFWVTGVRSILKADDLAVKAQILLDVERLHQSMAKEGEEFHYQLQVASARGGDGEVPADVKAILAYPGCKNFLGVQMQVSLNNVQGKSYPYFYCVLVAQPELNLLDKTHLGKMPRKVIMEPKHENDVDIIVIRQRTTKNSGYHTKRDAIRRIAAFAIEEARRVVG